MFEVIFRRDGGDLIATAGVIVVVVSFASSSSSTFALLVEGTFVRVDALPI